MSDPNPEEMETAAAIHNEIDPGLCLDGCGTCRMIAKAIHSHAEEAEARGRQAKADAVYQQGLMKGRQEVEEAVTARDREWTDALLGITKATITPGEADERVSRHYRDKINEAVKAATEELRATLERQAEFRRNWKARFHEERQAREKEEGENVLVRKVLLDDGWGGPESPTHRIQTPAQRIELRLSELKTLCEANSKAREKAEKLASDLDAKSNHNYEQACRLEKERDYFTTSYQYALADGLRYAKERDAALAEVERLKGDKKRCHALLQDAFNHIDPGEFSFLQNNILKELDDKCEPGACTDSCETTTENLRAKLKKAKKALSHVAHDAAEWSTIATQRHDENAALRKRVEELEAVEKDFQRRLDDGCTWADCVDENGKHEKAEFLLPLCLRHYNTNASGKMVEQARQEGRAEAVANADALLTTIEEQRDRIRELEAEQGAAGALVDRLQGLAYRPVETLEQARREGAEEMREVVAQWLQDLAVRQREELGLAAEEHACHTERLATKIRALPIDQPKAEPSEELFVQIRADANLRPAMPKPVPYGFGSPFGVVFAARGKPIPRPPHYPDPPKAQYNPNRHAPTCPYHSREAARGDSSADCNCLEEEKPKEAKIQHAYREGWEPVPAGSYCVHMVEGERNGFAYQDYCGKLEVDHEADGVLDRLCDELGIERPR
jgi:hypothetical protein